MIGKVCLSFGHQLLNGLCFARLAKYYLLHTLLQCRIKWQLFLANAYSCHFICYFSVLSCVIR